MDLSDLLEPERIRCHCDVQSKKRTLQTLAELLGESLRAKPEDPQTEDAPDSEAGKSGKGNGKTSVQGEATDASAKTNGNGGVLKKKMSRKSADKPEDTPETLSDMEILDALISRERLGSTGLGHGVALPHSRLSRIDKPLAAFVTLDKGVDYESADGQPVDLVLGLLVPEHCNDEHLKILARLAKRFSDEKLRDTLRSFNDAERLYAHLASLTDPAD